MNNKEINNKIIKLQDKIEDATYEYNIYIKKLKLRIELLQEQVETFNTICCNKTFTTNKDYNKHLKSQEHRLTNEKWIHCPVCRKTFFGYSKEEYTKLPTVDKMKTEYYKHLNDCIYCPKCDEQFRNHMSKKRHECIIPMQALEPMQSTYDTYNDEIDIDSQFDYFLLESLSKDQANQLQLFIKNLPEGDYSITEITDSGLYYVIYETSDNIKVEVVRFKVSTRDEDFLVRLNFIYP